MEYHMTIHVFRNSPSSVVVTYGLRRASQDQGDGDHTKKQFVGCHFYVDDGLISFPSDSGAVAVETLGGQEILAVSNLKQHKIDSNSINTMEAFPKEDLAKGLKDLDLGADLPPMQ